MRCPSHALVGWFACLAVSALCGLPLAAAAEAPTLDTILDALNSVHPFSEVALSPDGKHLVYGSVSTGKRGGADVDVSALYFHFGTLMPFRVGASIP